MISKQQLELLLDFGGWALQSEQIESFGGGMSRSKIIEVTSKNFSDSDIFNLGLGVFATVWGEIHGKNNADKIKNINKISSLFEVSLTDTQLALLHEFINELQYINLNDSPKKLLKRFEQNLATESKSSFIQVESVLKENLDEINKIYGLYSTYQIAADKQKTQELQKHVTKLETIISEYEKDLKSPFTLAAKKVETGLKNLGRDIKYKTSKDFKLKVHTGQTPKHLSSFVPKSVDDDR